MSASTTMTIRIPTAIKDKLDRIAVDTKRSKSFLAGEAVTAYVERELEVIEGIKRGLDDATAGRLVPHDEAVEQMRAMVAKAKKRKDAGA